MNKLCTFFSKFQSRTCREILNLNYFIFILRIHRFSQNARFKIVEKIVADLFSAEEKRNEAIKIYSRE